MNDPRTPSPVLAECEACGLTSEDGHLPVICDDCHGERLSRERQRGIEEGYKLAASVVDDLAMRAFRDRNDDVAKDLRDLASSLRKSAESFRPPPLKEPNEGVRHG